VPPEAMRFWGWGSDEGAAGTAVPTHAAAWLEERLRAPLPATPRAATTIDDVRLPPSALPDAARAALVAAVGEQGVREDHAARVRHAAGRSYPDLLALRAGTPAGAPDAVVLPADEGQVRAVLEACAREGVAVVPFGGGTSVVGGVEPLRGPFASVVALDLGRLDGIEALDEVSQLAVVRAGTSAADLERALGERGLTLGHLPQSFEHVSIGGCVATRSAGQASAGYGRIEDLVLGLRAVAPAGEIDLPPVPATAAGPSLRGLLVGSEGTLAVLTAVALHVRPAPAERRYEAVVLPGLAAGLDAFRALAQQGATPDVARLSDEDETAMTLAFAGTTGLRPAALGAYLRVRGVAGGCLAILGWEGAGAGQVRARREATMAILREHGAVSLGAAPGRLWARTRFRGPYLRDALMDRGVLVDTLETAAPWSALPRLHAAVRDALCPHAAVVGCHVSHVYPTGASLYFTFLARRDERDPLGQWRTMKRAATDAIIERGGTLTHHHAVGRDHAPWLAREVGEVGVAALRALKRELDPAGILNPGKLAGGLV
jgi:alkyldihydroxyacetonephosphate synthase